MSIRTLDALRPEDQETSGGKAYNCARLRQAGFPVPDGLVIQANVPDADLPALTSHAWFDQWPPDAVFAVRSSGLEEDGEAQSFAGIHETLLNVRRDDIVDAVSACRASAFSPRALTYRRNRGLSVDSIHTAVLVQRMIHPVAAGVAFTINPLTGATDEIVINSSTGLGEDLVGGLVDPDEFIVRKIDRSVLSSRLGDKGIPDAAPMPSLDRSRLAELAGLAISIEKIWNAPQDIEWCYDGAQFWIVQTRPVTTPTRAADGKDTEWTRANLAEVLPEFTSPQSLATTTELLNIAERRYMGRLLAPDEELGPMVKSFYGRLYLNLSQLRRVCLIGGTPVAAVMRSLGHAGEIHPQDELVHRAPLRLQLACIPDFVRLLRRHFGAERLVRDHEARTSAFRARLASLDPEAMSNAEIWALIDEWRRKAPDTIEVILVFGGVVVHELPLRKMCEQAGFPFERLLFSQLAAGERSVSAQQAFDLVEMADRGRGEPAVVDWFARGDLDAASMRRVLSGTVFIDRFDRFLEMYGHRGLFESDWALPRYSEDPAPLLHAIRAHILDPAPASALDRITSQKEEAETVWREFDAQLTLMQRLTLLPRIRAKVRRIKQYYVWRERCRSDMVRSVAVIRRWLLVVAERLVDRGWLDVSSQFFLLTLDEIGHALQDEREGRRLRTTAAARASELEHYRQIPMPLLMRESELPRLIRAANALVVSDEGEDLYGLTVSCGSVEAEVVVIEHPGDFGQMKRGAILVTRATDPSWTPLFTLASGVIVEVGGVLSHASTIAREFGLPALANVKNATKRLRTGERVTLNATDGVIHRQSTVVRT